MHASVGFLRTGLVLDLSTLYVDDVKHVPRNLPELRPAAGNWKRTEK